MIGAFARILDMPPLSAIAEAIREEIPARAEANIGAAQEAFQSVSLAPFPGGSVGP